MCVLGHTMKIISCCRSFLTVCLLDRYLHTFVAFMPLCPTCLAQTHISNLTCYYSFSFNLSFIYMNVPCSLIHFYSPRPLPMSIPPWTPFPHSKPVIPNHSSRKTQNKPHFLSKTFQIRQSKWITTFLGSHRKIYYCTQVILSYQVLNWHVSPFLSPFIQSLLWQLQQAPLSPSLRNYTASVLTQLPVTGDLVPLEFRYG